MIDIEKPDLNELTHHGIRGMRWGHHREIENQQRSIYGLTKKETKKKINKAPNTHHQAIRKKYQNALSKAFQDSGLTKKYHTLGLDRDDLDIREYDKRWEQWSKEASVVKRTVAKQFVSEFDTARLKDIDYKDIQKGKAMLKTYDMHFRVTSDGNIITTTGSLTKLY